MNIISLVNEIVEVDKRLGNEIGLWLELDDDPCSDEIAKDSLDDTITKKQKTQKNSLRETRKSCSRRSRKL